MSEKDALVGALKASLAKRTRLGTRSSKSLELEGEVSRLREALERIVDGVWPIGGYDDMTGADHMREIARAALATAKAKGG